MADMKRISHFIFCALFFWVRIFTANGLFTYKSTISSLEIFINNRLILKHTEEKPVVEIGQGNAEYNDDLGNFHIHSTIIQKVPLCFAKVLDEPPTSNADGQLGESPFSVTFSSLDKATAVTLQFSNKKNQNAISVQEISKGPWNRLWIRLHAEKEEHIYGGGEQFSYFSLRGRAYPMWIREQGVGRNKTTTITKLADYFAGAGGDYHTTYWPQPTFVSDRLYYAHLEYYSYSVLNFSSSDFLELELWEDLHKAHLYFGTANSWQNLLEKMTSFFGRQPNLPNWIYNGAIIGLQGGTDRVIAKYRQLKEQGVKVSAIWIQDWSGKMMTSLGKRVYWNWMWSPEMYPNLDKIIKQYKEEQNVRFLSYINPHVINGSEMFKYGDKEGYFIKSSKTGVTKIIEFGEMPCGSVDFSNPKAYAWYKEVVKGMARFGFSGWMADFGGEYLPIDDDVEYYDKDKTHAEMHNLYSEVWAKLNREAMEEMGLLHETFIFMRSGFGKSPGYTTTTWAGDQNSDFSYADGLASVVPAALSMGMSGMGIHHSDVGGYVSLICMVRTEELILRWAEMNMFTPILRTHEGNRPYNNWQIYTTNHTAKAFGRFTKIFIELTPYHQFVAEENSKFGYPAQRPLFFHYPDDPIAYNIKFQYMYGPDLLVAPVFLENHRRKLVYLPADDWIYLWNGTKISVSKSDVGSGSFVFVEAELGNPPVFYKKETNWSKLFENLRLYSEPIEAEGLSWDLLWNNPIIFLYLCFRKLFWYVLFNV